MAATLTDGPQAGGVLPESPTGLAGGVSGWANKRERLLVGGVTAALFIALFFEPFVLLVQDWWTVPEAGHGLLLAPVAIWLAWKAGLGSGRVAAPIAGLIILAIAVLIRLASGLAAELFSMRASMVMALFALVVHYWGWSQARRWFLPFLLVSLSIPLPELVTQALALPLQFKASQMGAALLGLRHVPVLLTGNVIRLPGHELFVTEACSGLRSLTALLSTGVLLASVALKRPGTRVLLVVSAVPIAVVINGVRVFLTGFLVFFVSPKFGTGFMHLTEGWLLFLVSLGSLALVASAMAFVEKRVARRSEAKNA